MIIYSKKNIMMKYFCLLREDSQLFKGVSTSCKLSCTHLLQSGIVNHNAIVCAHPIGPFSLEVQRLAGTRGPASWLVNPQRIRK